MLEVYKKQNIRSSLNIAECKGSSIPGFVERKGELTTVSMTYTTRVLVPAAEQI